MRRLEILIDLARELSGNQRYDANSGVSQNVFVNYFQSAQDSLVKNIVNVKSKYFLKDVTVPVVAGQELYSYPSDMFLFNFDTVEWSQNNLNWIPLDRSITKDRQNIRVGYPFGYWCNQDGYHLTPPLTSGYLRLNYIRQIPRLEKRSGIVASVVGTPITSITLTTSDASDDETYLNKFDTISIVGRDGVQKIASIPITGVSTGTITVSSYTLASGEAVAAGDYVCAGNNATNKPLFPDFCETFFLKYAAYCAKYGDSSKWEAETKSDMTQSMSELIDNFKLMTDDISNVPITSFDYLSLWSIVPVLVISGSLLSGLLGLW